MISTVKFIIRRAVNSQYYWVLKAANNETVAVSECYMTEWGATHSVERVIELASIATIESET